MEFREWYAQRVATASSSGPGFAINIRSNVEYQRFHKGSTVVSLERALKTSHGWEFYYARVLNMLAEHQLNHAAQMWVKVCSFAKRISGNDSAREREYLENYFFQNQMGRGLVVEHCVLQCGRFGCDRCVHQSLSSRCACRSLPSAVCVINP